MSAKPLPLLPSITGAKGGGGGTESPDSLRSLQVADIVDLISEGEIEGLTFGLRSIYFDSVPLQNADGSYNFSDVQVQIVPGTQGQASITGGDGVQTETAVAVDVTHATPVVRSITSSAVDRVRVTIEVPQLSYQDTSTGDLRGTSFEWAIDVQSAGGGYVEVLTDVVDGKTLSRYTRSKEFSLPGNAPWDIRLRRITADSSSAALVNLFRWSSYTAIQSLKLRFPNSALVRTRINAQQFSRIPTRAFDLMGIKVRVPSNYDPIAKTYTGTWDGTFVSRWTDCPAWQFYELVTNQRWGLGRYFTVTPALKWTMYAIGQYCDEMVDDGFGGTEPRFRAGIYLSTREQAYKVVTDMAAIFRGMAYWANTDLAVTQDAPAAATAMPFTAANVIGGKFSYSGASASKRHSQFVVWFNDLANFGKLTPEVVVDADLERRVGIRSLDLNPLGVWSRGQAHRVGQWARFSEMYEGEAVTFRVGLDGTLVAPGSIFEIADPNEAGERLGGRIHAATTSVVTLDAPVTLASGESYTLTVMITDPDDPARLVAQERAVTTAAGTVSAITVSPAFSAAPAVASVWVLKSDAVQTTAWRCLAVAPVQGENQFEISGLRHYAGKYALIENGIQLELPSVSRIGTVPPPPVSVTITETAYLFGGMSRSRVTLSWPEPAPALQYIVSWRLDLGAWVELPATTANSVDVDGLNPGTLDVRVRSKNVLKSVSPAVEATATLVGWTKVPAAVDGFRIERAFPGGIELRWTSSTVTGLRTELRLNGDDWANGIQIYNGASDSFPYLWPADGHYVIRARYSDGWGLYSATDAVIDFDIVDGVIVGDYIVDPLAGQWQRSDGSVTQWQRAIIDPESGLVIGYEDVNWTITATLDTKLPWAVNFDARNDRIATLPEDPVIAVDGSAVDHVLKADGSADVSFEWVWSGDESTIDGFEVLLYTSASADAYTVGTSPAAERVTGVPAYKRAMLAYGLNSNSYLSWAVRAFRVVDPDIDASGVLYSAWVQPTGTGEAPYRPASNVAFSGDVTGTISGIAASNASTWQATSTNFDARNDRIGTTPAAPTTATDGTSVDHVINGNGSADVSFEWAWSGDESTIDGFEVLLYLSSSSSTYTIGTSPAAEQVIAVPANKRALLSYGINPTAYETWAVRTYRVVDPDVNAAGILRSSWVRPGGSGENPYRPASNVAFAGDLTGTINGIPASNASTWDTAATNFNSRNDRLSSAITAPTIAGDGTAVDHSVNSNGSVDLSFEWSWGGSEADIDGFEVLLRVSNSSGAYTIGTSPAQELVLGMPANKRAMFFLGLQPTNWHTFGVRAYRIVDPDVASGGRIFSAWVQPAASGENPYQPATSVAFAGDVTGTVGGIAVEDVNQWSAIFGVSVASDQLAVGAANEVFDVDFDATGVSHSNIA